VSNHRPGQNRPDPTAADTPRGRALMPRGDKSKYTDNLS
jgi:hypothetical protein